MLVVGKREAEERKVSIRRLGSQESKVMGLEEALAMLRPRPCRRIWLALLDRMGVGFAPLPNVL